MRRGPHGRGQTLAKNHTAIFFDTENTISLRNTLGMGNGAAAKPHHPAYATKCAARAMAAHAVGVRVPVCAHTKCCGCRCVMARIQGPSQPQRAWTRQSEERTYQRGRIARSRRANKQSGSARRRRRRSKRPSVRDMSRPPPLMARPRHQTRQQQQKQQKQKKQQQQQQRQPSAAKELLHRQRPWRPKAVLQRLTPFLRARRQRVRLPRLEKRAAAAAAAACGQSSRQLRKRQSHLLQVRRAHARVHAGTDQHLCRTR